MCARIVSTNKNANIWKCLRAMCLHNIFHSTAGYKIYTGQRHTFRERISELVFCSPCEWKYAFDLCQWVKMRIYGFKSKYFEYIASGLSHKDYLWSKISRKSFSERQKVLLQLTSCIIQEVLATYETVSNFQMYIQCLSLIWNKYSGSNRIFYLQSKQFRCFLNCQILTTFQFSQFIYP